MDLVTLSSHKSNYPDPISFEEGDEVTIHHLDTDYPGWVKVSTKDGKAGWAPIEYLSSVAEDGPSIALKEYSAKELDVEIGEQLKLIHELNDWVWVNKLDGESGWIPLSITKPMK